MSRIRRIPALLLAAVFATASPAAVFAAELTENIENETETVPVDGTADILEDESATEDESVVIENEEVADASTGIPAAAESEEDADGTDFGGNEEIPSAETGSVIEETEETAASVTHKKKASDNNGVSTGIIKTETETNTTDDDGYVTIKVYTPDEYTEDGRFPISIVMSSDETGTVEAVVAYSSQEIRFVPAAYKIEKVTDGNGRKMAAGATLEIEGDTEALYLDFTKPKNETLSIILNGLLANIIFIPILAAAYFGFRWWFKNN